MNDKQIQDKLEGLNALEGGIVYAKETAWEKLQTRMDQPAKKAWILPARMAAAAVLLLIASAGGYYYLTDTTDHKITVAQLTVPTPAVIEPVTIVQTAAPEISLPIETTQTTKRKYDTPHVLISTKLPEIITTEAETKTEPETLVSVDTPQKQEPIAVSKMRVVHINNMGKPEAENETPAYVYNGPKLDISKMKIVSINDVQRYEMMYQKEEEMMRMVRMSRNYNEGFLSVVNPFGRNYNLYSQSSFSIRLNRNK